MKSSSSKDSQLFKDYYGRNSSQPPTEMDAHISRGYSWNNHSKTGSQLHSNKVSESLFDRQMSYDETSPLKIRGDLDSRHLPLYGMKPVKSEFSPFESTKVLKQKMMSKDAVLTNSILMQQRSQHYLNRSIRTTHLSNQNKPSADSLQAKEEAFKMNQNREPQTASTGVFSSGGISNKIDPSTKDSRLQQPSDFYPVYGNSGARFLPSVGKTNPTSKEDIEKNVLASEIVLKWTEGKAPKKVIVVPGRIVNVVV